ncbi:MAG: hypothetical protein RMI30_03245 [Thermodesulfovibrio sp.]|nr:hypothetical protein [Thermodesulfovibrio sp.]
MYRMIKAQIWTSPWFFELSQEQKLLYIYLSTSVHTNQLGVYKATIRHIELETGLSNVESLLASLYPHIIYVPAIKLIVVKDFIKSQYNLNIKIEKSIYNKFIEEPEEVQTVLLENIDFLRNIIEKFEEREEEISFTSQDSLPRGYLSNTSPISLSDALSIPYLYIMDNLSLPLKYPNDMVPMGHPPAKKALSEGERETKIDASEPVFPLQTSNSSSSIIDAYIPKEDTENIKNKNINTGLFLESYREIVNSLGEYASTNVDEQNALTEKKTKRKKKPKTQKQTKYPETVKNLAEEFRKYREEFLGVPITHRNWHLKAYAVINKLLKKYSPAELHEALQDLQTEYWEDKARKIWEVWHFEDWLPRWKLWKKTKLNTKPAKKKDENKRREKERGLEEEDEWREEFKRVYGIYPEEEEYIDATVGEYFKDKK